MIIINNQSHTFWVLGLIFFISAIVPASGTDILQIPLAYAFDWDLIAKLPIEISFNHSYVYSTSPTDQLYLLKFNLSVEVRSFPTHQDQDRVQIGLMYPSDFITAMAATQKISYEQVQFGKEEYLSVILFDDNYVESRDIFLNGDSYDVHVKYNFGDDMMIDDNPCSLIDGSIVYFEEYLIRQALSTMTKENMLNFRFNEDNHTITLIGTLQNFPKLTLVRGKYIFQLTIEGNIIYYTSSLDNPDRMTLVGYKALTKFDKFKFDQQYVIFKRTSLVYQLYLFLLYFTLLSLLIIYLTRKNIYDTSQFIKHILKWVFMKDRISRVQVLKSELE